MILAGAGPSWLGIPFAQSWSETAAGIGAVGALWFAITTARRDRRHNQANQARLILPDLDPMAQVADDDVPVPYRVRVTNNSDRPVFDVRFGRRADVRRYWSAARRDDEAGFEHQWALDHPVGAARIDPGETTGVGILIPQDDEEAGWILFIDAEGREWTRDLETGKVARGTGEGASLLTLWVVTEIARRRGRKRC